MYRQFRKNEPLLFELPEGGRGYSLPKPFGKEKEVPKNLKRQKELKLPNISEPEVIRHYTRLSKKNYGVDDDIYPLGSCTMKYNPKINEEMALLPNFDIHPDQDPSTCQGSLELMFRTQEILKQIAGMDAVSLQPAAGAHGEYTGSLLIRAYHKDNGNNRNEMLVPDSAHGTNPASAALAGFKTVQIPSNSEGTVDIEALKAAVNGNTAGLMLTNPNTLGIFENNIGEIADIVHTAGGLLYYDGANLNAIMGISCPGDFKFDVMHFNLHKTFSTPHGGGGPGSGPVACKKILEPYLPVPRIERDGKKYTLNSKYPKTIGRIRSYYGNFSVIVKAFTYFLTMGSDLREAAVESVLNANYITQKLKNDYELPYRELRKHEVVFSGEKIKKETGVTTLDIAKRLLDYGIHAPTIYFPLIIHEAIMIEPTETESKENLDRLIDALKKIKKEAYDNPEIVKSAPHNTSVGRLDLTKAAREPKVSFGMC